MSLIITLLTLSSRAKEKPQTQRRKMIRPRRSTESARRLDARPHTPFVLQVHLRGSVFLCIKEINDRLTYTLLDLDRLIDGNSSVSSQVC